MKHILTTFLLFFALFSFAQTQQPAIICGNEVFSNIVKEHYPALQQAFDQTFEAAQQAAPVADRSPLTINVVVHVVWKNAEENLPDSVIQNQIQVLNADYNRLNADTGNLRALFQPVAGNAQIQFNLAGVERVQTTKLFEVDPLGTTLLSELKHDSQGGSDAWDTEHYLNIWVCKIQPITIFGLEVGQILGFAFPPNNLDNWPANSGAPTAAEDGVVIDFRAFGSNNPNTINDPGGTGALTIRGRTPVHEVGHYLGLRHIWGDGGILGLPNNCAETDGIDDTPFANAQSNFDCDTTRNTCSQVEQFYNADMPDLIENYMDYSSESCMNMFTKGQVAHMRNVLTGPRAGLLMPATAVHNVMDAASWSVFPNPAHDDLNIRTEEAGGLVQIFDLQGNMLRSVLLNKSVQRIDLQGLAAGSYFVRLSSEKGGSVKKVVVF